MSDLVRFEFWPDSLPGLNTFVEVYEHSYPAAKHKVLKYIYLHQQYKHPVRGVKPDNWSDHE